MKVVISGGLGFIGLRLAQAFAGEGHRVAILDNLHQQIHKNESAAQFARTFAEVHIGDVRDSAAWDAVLPKAELVLHMAAETGTGQSMDEIVRYTETNVGGTAQLAEALNRHDSVCKVFLPSSRAIYGEGAYRCPSHGFVLPSKRSRKDLNEGLFDLRCPLCGDLAAPAATNEDTEPRPASIYASTKLAQEHILQIACDARGVDLRVARYQNVYGPGQALGNPYTGVLVIFAQQISSGRELNIYEDGRIVRDFIYVDDVVAATKRIIEEPRSAGPINVGSGVPSTLLDIVGAFEAALQKSVPYRISGDFRFGDVRHALADIEALRSLGFEPTVDLKSGISEVLSWVKDA